MDNRMTETGDPTRPVTTMVIFGASGDLTQRKLIPALFSNHLKGRLPPHLRIVGVARREWTHDTFRAHLREGVERYGQRNAMDAWHGFATRIHYVQSDLSRPAEYVRFREELARIESAPADRLYYLALSPEHYIPVCRNLAEAGMAEESEGWRRIIIEKPFGRDLESALALNRQVLAAFNERQIYRIDHYLGKETAQNILFLRFANTLFEPVWNRRYVANIQITVAENIGVGHRAGYYDKAGVLRDMFQNHLLQLLALVAMEPPASLAADAIRNERVKLLGTIRPIRLEDTVRGQYAGYRAIDGVAAGSQTPTYAALRLFIDNWRWQGVPFYLRSGKAMPARSSAIIVEFQSPPDVMFNLGGKTSFTPNYLSICIQPDEGVQLRFETKIPDTVAESRSVNMNFSYHDAFPDIVLPDAYERLLLDALKGDASLFSRSDGIETAWHLIDPILKGWDTQPDVSPLHIYPEASWGPPAADRLPAQTGHKWRMGCCGLPCQ